MKDINLSEVFCEVVGGLAGILLCVLFLDLTGVVALERLLAAWRANASLGLVTGVVVIAYLVGLVVDAVSLVFGEWFLDDLTCKNENTEDVLAVFYKTVQEHILKYRDLQWTYYSLYRNLLVLSVPLSLTSALVLVERGHNGWAVFVALLFLALGTCFFFAMRSLLALYYRIPKLCAKP